MIDERKGLKRLMRDCGTLSESGRFTAQRGNEVRELGLYLSKAEAWAAGVQPRLHFERFIEKADKLSAGRRSGLAMYVTELRGMKTVSHVDEDLLAQQERQMWGDAAAEAGEDAKPASSHKPSGPVELTNEQHQRMVQKKKEALQKNAARNARKIQANAEIQEATQMVDDSLPDEEELASLMAVANNQIEEEEIQMQLELEAEEAIEEELLGRSQTFSDEKQDESLLPDSAVEMIEMEQSGTAFANTNESFKQDSAIEMMEMEQSGTAFATADEL